MTYVEELDLEIPIHTHEHVLGVDIGVPQLKHVCDMYGLDYPYNRNVEIRIEAVGERRLIDRRDMRYLSAWSRRNLFRGVP